MGNSEGECLIGDVGGALGPPPRDWETALEPCGALEVKLCQLRSASNMVRSRNGIAEVDARSGFRGRLFDIPGAREAPCLGPSPTLDMPCGDCTFSR